MLLWKVPSDNKEYPKFSYHIAAIELTDRRDTEPEEWQDKFDSLFSYRCVVWWLKQLFHDTDIVFHVVYAGREDST